MILHSIEITHVGRFRGTHRLGPFHDGINILGAPNESGKTTTLRAAARGLFDRHTTKGDEIKSLQPAGSDLAPRVQVEFGAGAGRYRITKTFLVGPRSHFHRWNGETWILEAESDAADQRVQALLRSGLPGRGATRPEHWGLLGFLWAEQGSPADWPDLDDSQFGQQLRSRLAQVVVDPVVDAVRSRLAGEWEPQLTLAGRPKAGGTLAQAEAELEDVTRQLEEVRRLRTEQESLLQGFQQLDQEVQGLETESIAQAQAAATLQEQAREDERLRARITMLEQALEHRREALASVHADSERLRRLREELVRHDAEAEREEVRMAAASLELNQMRERHESLEIGRVAAETALDGLRQRLRWVQGGLQGLRLRAEAEALGNRCRQAERIETERRGLEAERSRLPALTPAALRRIEALVENVRTLRTEARALGITVELRPETATSATVDSGPEQPLEAGSELRVHRPRRVEIQLRGWGTVVVQSGAVEAQDAADRLSAAESELATAWAETGVGSLEQAREAIQQRRELELRIQAGVDGMKPFLGDFRTVAALKEAFEGAARRADATQHKPLQGDPGIARSRTELEELEHSMAAEIAAGESRIRMLAQDLRQCTEEDRKLTQRQRESAAVAAEHRARARATAAEATTLEARFPKGTEAARSEAGLAFAEAEARVLAAKAALPPDSERLADRNRRAQTALLQVNEALHERRAQRDRTRGQLEALGGQGLFTRETELSERCEEVRIRRDSIRVRAVSARIAHGLIERRKAAAIRAVLAPLERRLSESFAEVSRVPDRRIFLDGQLRVEGIGTSRETAHAFGQLSQGAREQLLLCLRLAVAEELSRDEPQVLVLDDVLVNTDPLRQERLHDLLESRKDRLQVLILTCHPERYRGLGHALSWSRVGEPEA